jgi:site-specific DNA-methyltransferase (adenine-specific)
MGYHYRARYECILFFEKGKRRLADLGVPDVIEAPRVYNGYPTEKPVAVADVLVRQSSLPGELVVDPFMGSASTGVAAVRAGRDFAGADISASALKISRQRLSAERASEKRLVRVTAETWGGATKAGTISGGEAA